MRSEGISPLIVCALCDYIWKNRPSSQVQSSKSFYKTQPNSQLHTVLSWESHLLSSTTTIHPSIHPSIPITHLTRIPLPKPECPNPNSNSLSHHPHPQNATPAPHPTSSLTNHHITSSPSPFSPPSPLPSQHHPHAPSSSSSVSGRSTLRFCKYSLGKIIYTHLKI